MTLLSYTFFVIWLLKPSAQNNLAKGRIAELSPLWDAMDLSDLNLHLKHCSLALHESTAKMAS